MLGHWEIVIGFDGFNLVALLSEEIEIDAQSLWITRHIDYFVYSVFA